jgi:hypothetical protein
VSLTCFASYSLRGRPVFSFFTNPAMSQPATLLE